MTSRIPFLPVIGCLAVASLLLMTGRVEADLLNGLTSYWPMDTNMANVTENARHGAPVNDAVITNTAGQYQFGGGAVYLDGGLNGDFDYVDIIGEVFSDEAESYTISMWANLQGSTNNTTRAIWSTSPTYASELSLRNCTSTAPIRGNPYWYNQFNGAADTNYANTSVWINAGDWHQYAVSWDKTAGRLRYYIDGVKINEITGLGAKSPALTDGFHIGADRNGGRAFNGFIDEVAVWDRELDPTEVGQLMTAGTLFTPEPPTIVPIARDGLLAQYTFETRGGAAVSDGASAIGQVDDSAGNPAGPLHALGELDLHLFYSDNASPTPGSNHSLYLDPPESHEPEYAYIPTTSGDALNGITSNADFRIEAWFATTDTGRAVLAGSWFTGAPDTGVNLELYTGNNARFYIQGPAVTDLNVVLPTDSRDGQWHQLAGVRESGTVKLYYDGTEVGSKADASANFLSTNANFYLGRDGRATGGGTDFAGYLDAVRFYSSAVADTDYLVAAYEFEDVGGVSVYDGMSALGGVIEDSGASGAFDGMVAPETYGEPNYRADAPAVLTSSTYSLELDASSIPEDASIEITPELAAVTQGDFALETWFKTTDQGRGLLIGCYQTNIGEINLELHDGNDVRIWMGGDGTVTDLRVNAPAGIDTRDGQWHHVVGQREGNVVSLWVDGLLAGTGTDNTGAYTLTGEKLYLGRDIRTDSTRFEGNLDDVRIWGRALSEAEIESLALGAVPVPEPAGIVLMLIGLTALCYAARHRKEVR